jgi:hypothetical protein
MKQKIEIPQKGFFRDFSGRNHDYYFDGRKMTGCTTILGVISKPALIPWASRMACEYVRDNLKSMDDLENVLALAVKAHSAKKDKAASQGTDVHAMAEQYIKECIGFGGQAFMLADTSPIFTFSRWAVDNGVKFLESEVALYSETLFVAGTADMIFEKDGRRILGDIKTMVKLWDRTPFFQTAGYTIMSEEMGLPKVDGSCIILLNKEGEFVEDVWSFDVEGEKSGFLAAVELYRQINNFKLS